MNLNPLRTFYTLVLTQTMSQIGSQMTAFAMGLWIYQDTGQATPLALIGAFLFIPQALLGSVAGVVADRWQRKTILIVGDFGQAVPTFCLLLSLLAGTFELWQVYLAVLIQACFALFQQTAFTASITSLVPEEELDRANTMRQISQPAAGLVAPIIGGFLYAIIGLEGIIAIDLVTFLLAVGVVNLLTIPQPATSEPTAKQSIWADMLTGWEFLWMRPALMGLVAYVLFVNFMITGPAQLISPYVLELTQQESLVGIMMGLLNGGMFAGAIAFGVVGKRGGRIQLALTGLAAMSFFLIGFGVARSTLVLGVMIFLMLTPNIMVNSLFASMLQVKTPPDLQGRVFAVLHQLALVATPISMALVGPLVDKILNPARGEAGWWTIVDPLVGSQAGAEMGLLFVIGGATMLVSTVVVYAIPMLRNMEYDLPDFKPASAESPLEAPPEAPRGGMVAEANFDK